MKRFLIAGALSLAAVSLILFILFVSLAGTGELTRVEFLKTFTKFKAFKYGVIDMEEGDVKTFYKWSCVGRCHGKEPIETGRHTSREWLDIIGRMRDKNGANINGREIKAIAGYLQKNFGSNVPTILSPEANRFLKQRLWKSDFGESDLYVDIIYSPAAYFELMGGLLDAKKYEADRYIVFMVYFNTHQEQLKPFPVESLAILKDFSGEEFKPLDWKVTYESGDKHHLEGVLRFPRKANVKEGFMEIILRDLPGQKERVFRWELPIPEPPQQG